MYITILLSLISWIEKNVRGSHKKKQSINKFINFLSKLQLKVFSKNNLNKNNMKFNNKIGNYTIYTIMRDMAFFPKPSFLNVVRKLFRVYTETNNEKNNWSVKYFWRSLNFLYEARIQTAIRH